MRNTVVPAQIMTVEDKIAGSLSLKQVMLLLAPFFISTFIYVILPTQLSFSLYKVSLMILTFVVFLILTPRVKGRIVLDWLVLLLSYFFRPHTYVLDKNCSYLREITMSQKPKTIKTDKTIKESSLEDKPGLNTGRLIDLESLVNSRQKKLVFTFNKKRRTNAFWFK